MNNFKQYASSLSFFVSLLKATLHFPFGYNEDKTTYSKTYLSANHKEK